MSDTGNQTNLNKNSDDDEFPVAAIACLSVVGYLILVIGFLVIRRMLLTRGTCQSDCCAAENGTCCNYCAKISEACPCCCSSSTEGCLSAVCGKRKKTACVDLLLCNCCGCTENFCQPCQALLPSRSCCRFCFEEGCCGEHQCLPCGSCSTSCCNDDLGPNTCGFLCLEVKLRAPRREGHQRSTSAPPNGQQSRHYSPHEPREKSDNAHYIGHSAKYHVSDTISSTTKRSKDDSRVASAGDSQEYKKSSSRSIPISAPYHRQMPANKSNNAIMSDSSLNLKFESSQIRELANAPRTRPKKAFQENEHPHHLTRSTNPTNRSVNDMSKDQSVRWIFNTNSTDSSTGSGGKSTSRSRRSVHPGQRSQRFPNKILISSKSLSSSGEKSNLSEISFIQSSENSQSSLENSYSQSNLRRPLPSIRDTAKHSP